MRVEREEVFVYLANPDPAIYDEIVGNKIRFFLHPETLNELNIDKERIIYELKVEPTSSTRTLLPKEKKYFVKLHLNKRLSRFIRRLRPSSVEHSIFVSAELEKMIDKAPEIFAFLPETIGIVYNKIGMIIREKIPRPYVDEERILVPLFSLYSRDLKHKKNIPLFVQLVFLNNEDPVDYFIEFIVEPLFANMKFCIEEYGLLLEPHGQNVLAEINNAGEIKRLVHRDFQSMYVDSEIRKKKGLPLTFKKHIMGEECPKEVSYSVVYDQYIGCYLFDPFVRLISDTWSISSDKIILRIKQSFSKYFDRSLFPKNAYYKMQKKTFEDNDAEFKKYSRRPKYRP